MCPLKSIQRTGSPRNFGEFSVKSWIDSTSIWWQGPPGDWYSNALPLNTSLHLHQVAPSLALDPEQVSALQLGYIEARAAFQSIIEAQLRDEPLLLDRLNEGKQRQLSLPQLAIVNMWRSVQTELFPIEQQRLKKGLLPQKGSRLAYLRPIIDEWGILRCQRLAQLPELDWDERHPIILASHPLVRRFIRHEHEQHLHDGSRTFFNRITLYYLLIGSKRLIRSVIGSCIACNIRRGKAFLPPEPLLPPFRVQTEGRPFKRVGVDYAGPLKTREGSKFYILLLTCAVTRAIHLEVVTSLDARHCLMALERFFARRGVPREIHSDNAQTFQSVNRTLATMVRRVQEVAESPQVRDKFRIDWYFQAPRAPWWGGFFERLVGVVKSSLYHTSLRRTFDHEEVQTLVTKVEGIVNSRPLTDISESESALTPAHFFAGGSLLAIPPFPGRAATLVTSDNVLRDYVAFRSVQDAYWNRFQKDYLLELKRHHLPGAPSREPRLDELVLLVDEPGYAKGRGHWPLARVSRLIPGLDGAVRTVEIDIAGRKLTRPIQRLIPLEASRDPSASPPPREDVVNQVKALDHPQ
jgi:transposase InsO family protein